jgi:hypothetical protein
LRRSASAIIEGSTPCFSAAVVMISSSTYRNPRRSETSAPIRSPSDPIAREIATTLVTRAGMVVVTSRLLNVNEIPLPSGSRAVAI